MTQVRRTLLLASGQRIRAKYAEWVRQSVGCTHVVVVGGVQAAARKNWPKDPAVVAYIVDASGHKLADNLRTQYPEQRVLRLSRHKAVAAETLRTFRFATVPFNDTSDAPDPREALRATLAPRQEPSVPIVPSPHESAKSAESGPLEWLVRLRAAHLKQGYAHPPGLEDMAYLRQVEGVVLRAIPWLTIEQSCERRGTASCSTHILDKCVSALKGDVPAPSLTDERLAVVAKMAKVIQEKGPPRHKRQFATALYDVARKKYPALLAERWRALDGVLEEIMALARAEYDPKSRVIFGRDFEAAFANWPMIESAKACPEARASAATSFRPSCSSL